MRATRARGYATVLAMMMLVLGTTLSAWLYTMVQGATAMTRNEEAAARTRMVSESGLAYMQLKLREACAATAIPISTDQSAMMLQLGNALLPQMQAGTVELREDEFGIPSVHVLSTSVKGGTFTASLTLSKVYDPGFRLSVKGTAGSFSSTIGVEYLVGDGSTDAWMQYPLLSRDPMTVTGAAKVHHWNKEEGAADQDITGTPYAINPNDATAGYAMTFDDVPPPQDLQFPPIYLPDRVYQKLNALKGSAVLPNYVAAESGGGTGGGGKGSGNGGGGGKGGGNGDTVSTVTELADKYIPANTPITFADGAVLSGVIYVGYPNNLTFSDRVTINGIIIYEKPEIVPPEGDAPCAITLNRTIALNSDPTVTAEAVKSLMIRSGETTEAAAGYAEDVYPWTIHAPHTDLDLVEGNTGEVNYYGSFHVNDFLRAAGDGQGSPDRYVIHGTIVCEGDVTLTGNRSFSVSPESEARPNAEPENLALAVRPGGYWEE